MELAREQEKRFVIFIVSCSINHVLNFGDLDIMAIGELLEFGCPFKDICGHSII